MPKKIKHKFRLLSHEIELLASGELKDITHERASSKWLHAESGTTISDDSDGGNARVLCYRHMGDLEFQTLLNDNQLPSSQPYQNLDPKRRRSKIL